MNMSESEVCQVCNTGVSENIEHFLLDCPAYSDLRSEFFSFFVSQTTTDNFDITFAELLPATKVQFLIGDLGYLFSYDTGSFYDIFGKML